MFKKVFAIILASAALLLFASCGASSSSISEVVEESSSVADEGNSVAANSSVSIPEESGDSYAVGAKVSTYFFDFSVDSAKATDTYAGYTPEEGYKLIDVVITTTNTFGETFEMYDTDYQLQWNGREDFADPLEALDDTMAPAAHDLPNDGDMTFHYIFEVPADVTEFELCYLEEMADNTTGNIYFVSFTA